MSWRESEQRRLATKALIGGLKAGCPKALERLKAFTPELQEAYLRAARR